MKILFVAMQNSIHTERWIKQLNFKNNEIGIYPSVSGSPTNFFNKFNKVNIFSSNKNFKRFIFNYVTNKFLNNLILFFLKRSKLLIIDKLFLFACILKFKPNIIHTLEFQHAGYLYLSLRKNFLLKKRLINIKWIITNWGSDIYYFQKFPSHLKKIKLCLMFANYYSAECHRDYKIVKKLNQKITRLPLMPNAGGFNLKKIEKLRSNLIIDKRKQIIIKGYVSKFGQAELALKAIIEMQNKLTGFEIIFYSPSIYIQNKIKLLKNKTKLDIRFVKKQTHNQMLNLFSKSILYVGVSRSDGLSTSFLEAISLGAFPIQSGTSCCNEIIVHKKTGYILKNNTVKNIKTAINYALSNPKIIKNSFKENWIKCKIFGFK